MYCVAILACCTKYAELSLGMTRLYPVAARSSSKVTALRQRWYCNRNDIYIGMMVNPGKKEGAVGSSVTLHDCRSVVDSSPLKNTNACGGRGRGSFSSLGE